MSATTLSVHVVAAPPSRREVLSLSVRASVARVADEYGLDVIKKRREASWAAA